MKPKYQVRRSSNRKTVLIVNTRPTNGARWQVVGCCGTAEQAIEVCAGLNRDDERLAAKDAELGEAGI